MRRSPRLSQRFHSMHSTAHSDESLGRSSLVMTHQFTQGHTVLDESGQRLPGNETSNAVSTTKKFSQQRTSYSSTTGQPYTGSPVEVGTESSEESDTDGQSVGLVLAPSVTAGTAGSTSTSFRPKRTDMPRHLYGMLDKCFVCQISV